MNKNKHIAKCILAALLLCNAATSFSQVGINTLIPRKTLEVAGDVHFTEDLKIGVYNPVTDSDTHTFLIQNATNELETLDVSNPTTEALGYIQEYIIENPNGDWVYEFDTGIDATDYVVISISAHFSDEIKMQSSYRDDSSIPYTSTFIFNGTWHITADYPRAGPDAGIIGSWNIKTLIFSRDLSKQFGTINIPMSESTTGSATTPIID